MALTPREADTLFDEEITYPKEGFSKSEIKLMKMLCRDRVESRFRTAAKAANEMNLELLKATVDELVRLDELGEKFMEMMEDE